MQNTFRRVRGETNGYCANGMNGVNAMRATICMGLKLVGLKGKLKNKIADVMIMVGHKEFGINQLLSSFLDEHPVGNKRNVKNHIAVECKRARNSLQTAMKGGTSSKHAVCKGHIHQLVCRVSRFQQGVA